MSCVRVCSLLPCSRCSFLLRALRSFALPSLVSRGGACTAVEGSPLPSDVGFRPCSVPLALPGAPAPASSVLIQLCAFSVLRAVLFGPRVVEKSAVRFPRFTISRLSLSPSSGSRVLLTCPPSVPPGTQDAPGSPCPLSPALAWPLPQEQWGHLIHAPQAPSRTSGIQGSGVGEHH